MGIQGNKDCQALKKIQDLYDFKGDKGNAGLTRPQEPVGITCT